MDKKEIDTFFMELYAIACSSYSDVDVNDSECLEKLLLEIGFEEEEAYDYSSSITDKYRWAAMDLM